MPAKIRHSVKILFKTFASYPANEISVTPYHTELMNVSGDKCQREFFVCGLLQYPVDRIPEQIRLKIRAMLVNKI